jgi:class 3 adenylate cyclase/predicted ATPase
MWVGAVKLPIPHSRTLWRLGQYWFQYPVQTQAIEIIMDVGNWLRNLGLERFETAFRDNGIDETVLPHLTQDHMRELGLPLGARIKLLAAIATLSNEEEPHAPAPTTISASPSDAAERRQITVLFSDLVGSTALSTRMDPEDLRNLISAYQKCVTETIRRFGGFVAKYMGDGVLVYFGYPEAHEDDAERAVRSGLELVAEVAKLKTRTPLQTRVSIVTGLVVVGDLVGSGQAQERGIVGEPPNLATRLQGLAEPDMVVIADATRRLLGNLFELRDLGQQEIKGIAGTVRLWAVLRPSLVESRFEAFHASSLTTLVGREEEIDVLLRRWERAQRGDGCVVLISGEPGIGKSRIVQELLERLQGHSHAHPRYFCSPHNQASALYPIITHLERVTKLRREDTPEQRLAKLEAALARATDDLNKVVPPLADLLSIPTGERYPRFNFTPQQRKEKTLRALLAQVEGMAARQPVLMVFEDVHWSDPTSLELLDMTVDRIAHLPMLLIITFRPEFTSPWVGRSHVTLLTLNRLPPRQRAEMIARMSGGKALPKEIADQIIDRTDGVPLFIEELTKSVVESGLLAELEDRPAGARPIAALAIPTSLQASLLARLDRLAPTREVAQIGAALGRSFSHELISAVAGIPQQQLDESLKQLVSAGLIFQRGMLPEAEYTFKHALVQDAAYGTMLHSRRQQLHGRIAAILESQFPEMGEKRPELLARHCAEAGLVERAVAYLLKAGEQEIACGAMTEAVAQLGKALDLLSSLPDNERRQHQELDLQLMFGRALMAAKGYGAPELGEALARGRSLCEQLDRAEQLAPVMCGQWVFRSVRGELIQAEQHTEEVRRFADGRNDDVWKCFGHIISGDVSLWLGKFIDARTYLETALSLWEPSYRALGPLPEDTHVHILKFLYRTLVCIGYVDQARLRRDEALAEARRISPYNLASMLRHVWYGDWAIGGLELAQGLNRLTEEVLAIASEQGFALPFALANMARGWCLGVMGQPAEGILLIEQGLNKFPKGANLGRPFHLLALAELYGKAGQPEEGLKWLTEAAELVENTGERWAEAEMHRTRGTLLLSTSNHDGVEDSFNRALAVARRQGARFWELRAATCLAELWCDQGKRNEARDLLAPICGWFNEGLDTPDLKKAEAFLRALPS